MGCLPHTRLRPRWVVSALLLTLLTSCSWFGPRFALDGGAEVCIESDRYTLFMPWPDVDTGDVFIWRLLIDDQVDDVLAWFGAEPWRELIIRLVTRPEEARADEEAPRGFTFHRLGSPGEIYLFVPPQAEAAAAMNHESLSTLRHELTHVLLFRLAAPVDSAWIHEGLASAVAAILPLGAPRAWARLPQLSFDEGFEPDPASLAVGVPDLLAWELGHGPQTVGRGAAYTAAMSLVDFLLRREGDKPFPEALQHVADLDQERLLALEPEWNRLRAHRGF